MKHIKFLLTLFLTTLLGVGQMWATDVSGSISLGNTTGAWNATTTASFTDENNLSWSRTYSSGNKQSIQGGICQFGNSSNACTSLVFTTTIGQAVTLSAFSANFVGGATKTSGTIKLYSGTTELATATVSGTASVTCQISSSASVGASDAIKVEYTGTNGSIKISQIAYTYTTGGGGSTPTVKSVQFSPDGGTFANLQSVTLSQEDSKAIYYTADGTAGAGDPSIESPWNLYSSALNLTETTTIYAAAKDGDDWSSVVNKTFTIYPIAHAGTSEDPYTVADAHNAILVGGDLSNKYVSGIISQIDSYNSTYKSITYWISDDGTTTNQLEVYSGKGIDGEDFASQNDLAINDIVVVKGTLKDYNSTHEFDKNNELVSIDKPSVPTVTLKQSSSTVTALNLEATSVANQAIDIECTNFASTISSVTAKIYSESTCENEITSGAWVTDITVNGAKDQVTFNVADNEGEARQVWLKVTATDGTSEAFAVLAISQAKFAVDYATLPFEYDGNGSGDLPNGLTNSGVGTYSSSPAMKFDGKGDYIIIKINAAPGTLTYDIKGNSFSGGTFKVQESVDGTDYSDVATYTTLGDKQRESKTLAQATRYVKFIYTNKSSGNVALGNITISAYVAPTACEAPTFTPESGETFTETLDVVLASATPGATIYYTLDGEDPTTSSSVFDTKITLTETTTIKAIAVKGGLDNSSVASATYTKAVVVNSYDIDFETNDLTPYINWNFSNIACATSTITAHGGTYYGNTDGKATASITSKAKIAAPGTLTFWTSKESGNTTASYWTVEVSEDGSEWMQVGEQFSATTGDKGTWTKREADLSERTNVYVRISYGSSTAVRAIDDISLEMASAVKKPTIEGTTPFVTSTMVTLDCVTSGATIYYTTDGSDPKSGDVYSEPFSVTATTTVKAIAKLNEEWSNVNEKTFSQVDIWTVARANTELASSSSISGKYVRGIISQIDSYGSNTITYWISDDGYTAGQLEVYKGKNLDNTNFTAITDLKVGDIVVVYGDLTIYKGTNEFSQGNYLISKEAPVVATPVFSPDGGGFMGETSVSITCVTEGSVIYYTTDGSNPTNESTQYTEALPLSADATIKAIAYVGEEHSLVVTKTFTLSAPMTVADAYDALDSEDPLNNVAVVGIVYKVDRCTVGGNAQYWISDDGTAGTKVLEIYNGNGLNNAAFEANGIQVEDKVIVFGNLTIHSTTKEFSAGSRLLSLIRKEESGLAWSAESAVVGITGDKNYPNLTNPNTLDVTYQSTDEDVATIDGEGAISLKAAGTTTIRAIFAGNTSYKAATVSYELEVRDVLVKATIAFDCDGATSGCPAESMTDQTSLPNPLPTVEKTGYSFKGWYTNAEKTIAAVAGAALTEDVTLYAKWKLAPSFNSDDHEWIKITSASKLVAGRYYVIGVGAKGVTATNSLSGGYLDKVTSTFSQDKSVIAYNALGANTAIFELDGNTTDGWTLFEVTDEEHTGYLNGTTNSSLAWSESATVTPISFDEEGNAILGNGEEYRVLYNNSSPRFKPYTGAQTSMSLPQLYMWAELSHAVTFDANGGVAESVPGVERTDEGKIIIPETEPTHSVAGKVFAGWYQTSAPSVLYNAGDEFETNVDVTLYAKWNTVPTYTVTYVPGGSGTVPAVASYPAGRKVQVVTDVELSNPGYSFTGWTVKDADQNVLTVDEDNKFTMPAKNVTIVAGWARISNQKWVLVENVEDLKTDGTKYIIAGAEHNVGMGALNGSLYNSVGVTKDGKSLRGPEMTELTFEAGSEGKLAIKHGSKYVYSTSAKSIGERDEAFEWTISISEGVATINAGSAGTLQYNSGNPRFTTYTSTQQPVAIYIMSASVVVNNEKSISGITAGADVTVENGGVLTVDEDKNLGDLTVENGGKVVLDENKLTVVGVFSIESTMAGGTSGQLTGATLSNFAATGEAYIDITLGAGATGDQWHAFTVPFPVDAINGVFDLDGNKLANEVNYAIMDYHGDVRATGAYGWRKYRSVMVPGTFYLMTVDGERTTYRFKMKAGSAIIAGNSKEIFEYAASGSGEARDAGWNGIGNPNLFYGKVSVEVQVLDPISYTFVKKDANSTNFVVGTPFFYQAAAAGSISMLEANAGSNFAPRRDEAAGVEKIKVSFGNEDFTDYLDISASEDATNEYQIGKDLAKMTMTGTPKVAQIFGNAYNTKLCMVNAPMSNDQASYDLTLYAPAAGEYTIAVPAREEADIYLTKDGSIIWNLSASAFALELNKGNNEGYGLLLQKKAPQSPTGIDGVESSTAAQKVIINNNVFILRNGQMYDVTGKEL